MAYLWIRDFWRLLGKAAALGWNEVIVLGNIFIWVVQWAWAGPWWGPWDRHRNSEMSFRKKPVLNGRAREQGAAPRFVYPPPSSSHKSGSFWYLVYIPFFLQKEFFTDMRRLFSSRAGKLLSSRLTISPWLSALDLELLPKMGRGKQEQKLLVFWSIFFFRAQRLLPSSFLFQRTNFRSLF